MRSIDFARLARHARVWLDAATWRTHLQAPLDDTHAAHLDEWIGRGNALVGRRRVASARADDCFLGVALPLRADRLRIAVIVDRAAVVRIEPPLRLSEIVDGAPPVHRAALVELQRRGAAIDTGFRVFGSFAWQSIAGEPCVTPRSDLDLLWDARDPTHAARVVELLADWETCFTLRADGEARFPNGDAIAWRELTGRAHRVLAKRDDGVALVPSPLAPHRERCA